MLHDARNGLYYRSGDDWTSERDQAMDLKSTAMAVKLAVDLQLEDAEVVLGFADPLQDVYLPLKGAALPVAPKPAIPSRWRLDSQHAVITGQTIRNPNSLQNALRR
jgi:hypothetical protein